jgi:hypothetical protein
MHIFFVQDKVCPFVFYIGFIQSFDPRFISVSFYLRRELLFLSVRLIAQILWADDEKGADNMRSKASAALFSVFSFYSTTLRV